jgi:hypothetical protein
MRLVEYHESLADKWDAFIDEAPAGTFLHSRKFLGYHKERFTDKSIILQDDKEHITAVFPAAEDRNNTALIISHPGSTYGGIICRNGFSGNEVVDALTQIVRYYAALGYQGLRYKAVPYIYHEKPSEDDLYALFRLGAIRHRCDLSACIDLGHRGKTSSLRKRGLKKAEKQGLHITTADKHIPEFWQVLEGNLHSIHGQTPVHSLDEIQLLHSSFPSSIKFIMALYEGRVIAGVVLFSSRMTVHAQYIASNEQGRELAALDYVFEHCIQKAGAEGLRYFDFGTCNENEGKTLNSGLYKFKLGFGAGGVAYEFYNLDFNQIPSDL